MNIFGVFESHSYDETLEIARKLSGELKPSDVVALIGDLGCGKSAFAQGVASGLGVLEHTSSPTFTIVSEYDSGRIKLYHFDVYRIEDLDELEEVGFDDYIFGDGISVIEWADMVEDLLPNSYIKVEISKDLSISNDYRKIEINRINR